MADNKMIGALVAGISVFVIGVGGYFVAIFAPKKPRSPIASPAAGRRSATLDVRQDQTSPTHSGQQGGAGVSKTAQQGGAGASKVAATTTPPAVRVRLRYEVLLRSRSIHKVSGQGEIEKETLTIAQLTEIGEKAQREDRDLVLRVQGDAKAQWVQDVKRALSQKNIPFSIANEF